MTIIPFKKFVQAFLFMGERLPEIIKRLHDFGFVADEMDLGPVLQGIRDVLPKPLVEKLDSSTRFDIEEDKQWLQQFGIWEFYEFILNRSKRVGEKPEYDKWFNDCLWILNYKDATAMVNIFMFNSEPLESISDIISFKYKRKIGIDALKWYAKMFWDCSALSAKDALLHYMPFRDNTLIIRQIGCGVEVASYEEWEDDGSEKEIVFHDSNYIKWKIGFPDVKVPTPNDFLDKVMKDSYFKYCEALSMTQSVEMEDEAGSNDKIGAFSRTLKKRRNVQEQMAARAKGWLSTYLLANKYKSIDKGGENEDDLVDKLSNIRMDFPSEKLVSIDDAPDIMSDIKGDM